MKKIINIIGLFTFGLLLVAFITFTIGLLWDAPDEGLLHNLFRYSASVSFILGGIWIMLFVYNELKNE